MAKLIIFLLAGIILISCTQPKIAITGNLENSKTISANGNLAEIFEKAEIEAEYILVIASDGTAFFVSEKSISEIEITREKGNFNSKTSSLPPVCNLNNIVEICVYNSDFTQENQHNPFAERIAEFEFLGESSKAGHFVRKYKLKQENS